MSGEPFEFRDFEHRGWEQAAANYDRFFAPVTRQSIDSLLDVAGAGPGVQLLDIACGPGYAAAAAGRRGCQVLGMDFSAQMIAIAARRNPGLIFREGDAENLSLADSSFDAVVMNYGMLHLGNPPRAISEALRVLLRGGRYAFTVWDIPERAAGLGIVLDAVQSCGDMNVPLPEGPPFFLFADPEQGEAALRDKGFRNVQVQTVPQVWKLNRAEDLFTAFQTAAVRTAALLNAQKPHALDAIRRRIIDKAEGFRKGDAIYLPMPAVLTSAMKP